MSNFYTAEYLSERLAAVCKERDELRKSLHEAKSELVRCKDCKHRGTDECPMYYEENVAWQNDELNGTTGSVIVGSGRRTEMAEHIEREALKQKIVDEQTKKHVGIGNAGYEIGYHNGLSMAMAMVLTAPAADVAPVVHAKWEPVLDGVWNLPTPVPLGWSCPLCGRYEQYKESYCNCGARMDGE